jgi:hypothetical protein
MLLRAVVVVLLWSSGCRAPQSTPSEQPSEQSSEQQPTSATPTRPAVSAPPAPPAATGAQRTGAVLFCAYGGQGVLPAGAKPDAYYRVVLLFELTTPAGSPTETLPLTQLVLEDANGKPLARMRAPISVERAPRVALTSAWQSALDNHGPPFDHRYASGTTRVRVEAWLDTRPAVLPARVRVGLGSAPALVELSGTVAGEWPTG